MSKKGRDSRFNDYGKGQVGRITGQRMPTNVPRDEDGVEDVDVFFANSPKSAVRSKPIPSGGSVKRQKVSGNVVARGPRPDLHHDLGKVGRKTGQVFKEARRLTNGLEDPDDFFRSPNSTIAPSRKTFTADRSVEMGRRGNERRATGFSTFSNVGDDDDDDVMLDNSSDLSPGRYMNQSTSRSPNFRRISYSPALSPASRTRRTDALPSSSSDRSKGVKKAKVRTPTPESEVEDEDDVVQEEESESPAPAVRRYSKGKGRATISSGEDEEEEQEFMQDYGGPGSADEESSLAQDVMEVEQDDDDDDTERTKVSIELSETEEFPAPTRRSASPLKQKKSTPVKRKPPSPLKTKSTPKITKQKPTKRERSADDAEGLRRSTRPSEKPIAFWRNEKAVYERRKSGWTLTQVVRTEEVPVAMPHQKRPVSKRPRARSTPAIKEEPEGEQAGVIEDQYEGWDDGTVADGLTWDFLERTEKKRRIAFPRRLIDPGVVAKGAYKFQKIFSDGEYMACGILEIPIGSKKPIKSARDNSYMLYVEKGVVQVLVYRTTFPIAQGGFFFVPRGNTYEIENIGEHPCRLVFAQAREVKVATDLDMMDEDEEYGPDATAGDTSRYEPLSPVREEEDLSH